jgi:hypothetical protein
MKKEMTIIANLNEPCLLKTLVEMIASRHVDMGYSKATVPQQWKAIETSSTQAYVLGTFDLHTKRNKAEEQTIIPFTSSFLFTCLKDKYGSFKLVWSSSLS